VEIMRVLEGPGRRGRWLEARAIATIMDGGDYVDQPAVARVRNALRRLEEEGLVVRSGFMFAEWRSTRFAEIERPVHMQELADRFDAALRADGIEPAELAEWLAKNRDSGHARK
jgi:hypothetical protein